MRLRLGKIQVHEVDLRVNKMGRHLFGLELKFYRLALRVVKTSVVGRSHGKLCEFGFLKLVSRLTSTDRRKVLLRS